MKHFIVGPVEMYSCTREIYENPTVYFRTPEFSEIVTNCLDGLSKLIGNSTPKYVEDKAFWELFQELNLMLTLDHWKEITEVH